MNHNQQTLIYIHGFLSSPQSVKAQATKDYMEQHYPNIPMEIPQLSNYPDQALDQLETLVAKYKNHDLRFIGSSMGGFFSTYLVTHYGGKAVLINPAVTPHILLQDYLGEHENPYTKEIFTLVPKHMKHIEALLVEELRVPENIWTLLQTEDETLDYREAEIKYRDCKLTIEQGGDHSFQGFENYLPEITQFLFDSEQN